MMLVAVPALAEGEYSMPVKGGHGGTPKPPVVNPVVEPSSGGGGSAGLYSVLPRVAFFSQDGNTVYVLGSKFGFIFLEYEDGSRIYSDGAVFHTLIGKEGKATLWYVAVNSNGYEWKKMFISEIEI